MRDLKVRELELHFTQPSSAGDRGRNAPAFDIDPVSTTARAVRAHRRPPAVEPVPVESQLDLFPVPPVVELLDPRTAIGSHTNVQRLIRVRLRPDAAPHLVFLDRHGWYCEVHGSTCEAVRIARRADEQAT